MLSRRFLLSLFVAAPVLTVAQKPVVYKEPRILLLVDGSSSMLQNWGSKENRFQTASRLIETLMDSMYRINPNVEFGLRMYGQQSPAQDNNCYDTKREVMFSKNNRDQMSLRLAALRPYGISPIAYSLQRAAEEDLTEEHRYSYSIILLTDGGESCGGDLCAVSKALEQKAIFFRPYIISMVDYEPLRQQYQCLGEYLTVARQEQMKPTIQTILDAYRLGLRTVAETPVETPRPTPPPAPLPKPAPPPPPVEIRRDIALVWLPLSGTRIMPLPVKLPLPSPPTRFTIPKIPLPAPIAEAPPVVAPPPPPARIEIASLPFRAVPAIPAVAIKMPAAPAALAIPVLKRPAPEEEPVNLEPLTFVLRRGNIREMSVPVFVARTLPVPRIPLPKAIEEPKPTQVAAAPAPPKPATPPRPAAPSKEEKPTPVEFNARTERASTSGIMVFFTNGKGKYYKTTPQVEVRESATGKVVKKFFRTVDAQGEPDLQQLPPGTYDVVVVGKSNVMARHIPIGANETMNLQMVVTSGSLRFSYSTAPKRPVSEFTASVVRRFADDHNIVKQQGTEELPYEPGNYYLELNTLPVTRRNLDIDFGGTTEIQIAEPGWVQFTNTKPMAAKVVLYQPLGDGFASFLKMDITGDLEAQKIRLQPGTYEARWTTTTGGNTPIIVRFQVNSNETTMTELK